MEDIMFVLKCLVLTLVVVACLQIRVGGHTLEGHVMGWVHRSPVSQTLQDVAEGAVKAAGKGKEAVSQFIGSHDPIDEAVPTEASTGSWFKIKRSAAYYRQKEREAQRRRELQNEERDSGEDRRAPSEDSLD